MSTKITSLGRDVVYVNNENNEYKPDYGVNKKNMDDINLLNKLTRDINECDKESHKQIYMMLRRYQPMKIFTQEQNCIIFDRNSLTKTQLLELYNLIEMCKENMKRIKIVKKAENEYIGERDKNTSYLEDNRIPPSLDTYKPDFKDNPSEKQKVKNMLSLNNLKA
uniref:Uncharacterized protein n=1 Tax=viral metagenome TaxID=1070528 RepID=A0A6C0J7N9_9ZZZZ